MPVEEPDVQTSFGTTNVLAAGDTSANHLVFIDRQDAVIERLQTFLGGPRPQRPN